MVELPSIIIVVLVFSVSDGLGFQMSGFGADGPALSLNAI